MDPRLPSGLLIAALRRRVQDAGGFATVLASGDAGSGAILLVLRGPSEAPRLVERMPGLDGDRLEAVGPADAGSAIDDYWQRRRARDPDLWVVELDIAAAERFAAETILAS